MRKLLLLTLLLVGAALALENISGRYSGTWAGGSGSDGAIHVSLTAASDGKWSSDVSFTLGGDEVGCKVTSVKVDGADVEIVYQFDLAGNQLQSTIHGHLTGKTLEGEYKTKALADGSPVDTGTWTATLDR